MKRFAAALILGVSVLFVQNLAVPSEFSLQISGLEIQRFRDSRPFCAESGGFILLAQANLAVSGRPG